MKETYVERLRKRAEAGKLTRGLAIKAKCFECCGWRRFDGGVDSIGGCTCQKCPLWPFRPFQTRARIDASAVAPEKPASSGA